MVEGGWDRNAGRGRAVEPGCNTRRASVTWRLVRRCSELYGPLAALALAFVVLGRILGWDFSETPLVILTLPFSVAPVWFQAPPLVMIGTCSLMAAAIWAGLRWLRQRYSTQPGLRPEPRAAPGCLTAVVGLLLVLWVVALAISVGVFVRSHWFGPWPRLREAVRTFEVPPGFEKLSTGETGSEACFISCDEPRISVVLKTTLPPAEACRVLEARVRAVAKNVGPPPSYVVQPPAAACFLEGELPRVYSDARLSASVLSARELAGHTWLLAGASPASFAGADNVVVLLFNSGID